MYFKHRLKLAWINGARQTRQGSFLLITEFGHKDGHYHGSATSDQVTRGSATSSSQSPGFFNHVCQWGLHEVDGNSEDGAAHAGTSQAVWTAGLVSDLLVERYD